MELIKKRTVRVQGIGGAVARRRLEEVLDSVPGVEVANVGLRGKVSVQYDLLKVDLENLVNAIAASGFELRNSAWDRIKRGWFRFTEQNERDNLAAPAAPCCSNPKSLERRRNR